MVTMVTTNYINHNKSGKLGNQTNRGKYSHTGKFGNQGKRRNAGNHVGRY